MFDVVVVGAVLAAGQLDAWLGMGTSHAQGPTVARAVTYGLGAVLLLFRRAEPLLTLVGVAAVYGTAFLVWGAPEGLGVMLAPLVAVYSVGRWERRRAPWLGLAVVVALDVMQIARDPLNATWPDRFLSLMWVSPWVTAWLVGALLRSRAATSEERRLRQDELARLAVVQERGRIARELHDVVGHSVSVMTVQAGAVRRRLRPDQVAEREALESVEAVGRQAMADMRRMVEVLRDPSASSDRLPPPSLVHLDGLLDRVRLAGLPVCLTVIGERRELAPGVDATAFRIVQESLTNALRHAVDASRADVTLEYGSGALGITVVDDGRGDVTEVRPGHGILGMRERTAMFGGLVQAGPRNGGGFSVCATLPWASG